MKKKVATGVSLLAVKEFIRTFSSRFTYIHCNTTHRSVALALVAALISVPVQFTYTTNQKDLEMLSIQW